MCELHHIRDAQQNDLIYWCSRCKGCYVCEHEAILIEDVWMWRCKDGLVRNVIRDGGVY